MSGAISAHASDDYEALRDQLFGIERPGMRAGGYSVLIRCGLAVWARRHNEPPKAPFLDITPPRTVPTADEGARALLARLIANLILTPKESTSCQM